MPSIYQDGGHDVISRRKVMPSGKCTLSVEDICCLDFWYILLSLFCEYLYISLCSVCLFDITNKWTKLYNNVEISAYIQCRFLPLSHSLLLILLCEQ